MGFKHPELRALREVKRDYPSSPYLFVFELGWPMTPVSACGSKRLHVARLEPETNNRNSSIDRHLMQRSPSFNHSRVA
jgi:hypothetical protein